MKLGAKQVTGPFGARVQLMVVLMGTLCILGVLLLPGNQSPIGNFFLQARPPPQPAAPPTPPTLPTPPPAPQHPSLNCSGAGPDGRRCIITGAIFSGGAILLPPEDTATGLPGDVLCSVANLPGPSYRRPCVVRVAAPAEWDAASSAADAARCNLDVGVPLYRLNPYNAYHAIFEDMVPFYGMLREEAGIGADPAAVLEELKSAKIGVLLTDTMGVALDRVIWNTFLPDVKMVHPRGAACRVGRLIAGTRGRCAHWGHCSGGGGGYSPAGAAADFRAMVLAQLGLANDPPRPPPPPLPAVPNAMAAAAPPAAAVPRIIIVQRNRTRKISNLDEISEVAARVAGRAPEVVDFVKVSIHKQVRIMHDADIVVLVHGGALAHTIWLPFGAVLVDIYPYTFPVSDQSQLVHWVRHALPGLELLHHPFEVASSDDQELISGALPKDCRCQGQHKYTCQAETFWQTARVRVDPVAFEVHLRAAADRWRRHDFNPPCNSTTCFQELKRQAAAARPQDLEGHAWPDCMVFP